ncbi:DNA repair and recombination protein RadA [Candidatus Johnevansia muelleri]|uniref:DNA repair protein RadA n=1 Tax=Candidatus Johnevansia muelleri TaxID=1495769 RepID=A0A078KAT3_9GAMM|nr:DNA repair and recombination protein RadA [Candidatus Evansia muelleri]
MIKKNYICYECNTKYTKWLGKCINCLQWNKILEYKSSYYKNTLNKIIDISTINLNKVNKISSKFEEFDRVLGGGFIPGSTILLGGNPGTGKSTLFLQIANKLIIQNLKVLYITGEETLLQLAFRANRLFINKGIKLLQETSVTKIIDIIECNPMDIVIIDSIQTMIVENINKYLTGGVIQIRQSAYILINFAKKKGIVLLLIGHVIKDGNLAGPKLLEHMIDVSLMLETNQDYRMLRSTKNRFGSINELGIFKMLESGMKEVKDPSSIFISQNKENTPGNVVMIILEGTRPILVEIQALVEEHNKLINYKMISVGIDINRLSLLITILNKYTGLFIGNIFINVVGGIKIIETSADLAVLAVIISSLHNRYIPMEFVILGEVGLNGEIRPIINIENRLLEAIKHGFTKAIIPKNNIKSNFDFKKITIFCIEKISELLKIIL